MAGQVATHVTSFRVGTSFFLPAVLRTLGQTPELVFAEAKVDFALYSHPENRIPARDLGRLFACAERLTSRPDIALLVVESFRPAALGIIGELAAEGPIIHTALKNLVRLLQYNTLAGYPVLSVAEQTATMKFELGESGFPGSNYILEGATGIILRFMQWLCGESWTPDEVRLSRRTPTAPRPFEKFFGASVRFSSTEDAILFSAELLDFPVPRELRHRELRRIEIAAAPCSEMVRRQVAMRLGLASLAAKDIGQDLGVSSRQLFRRLETEGTTFQQLVDGFRFARAKHLLAIGDAPLTQISFALGYPEQSAFTRAFVRWSGVAPSEWRREAIAHRGNASPRS